MQEAAGPFLFRPLKTCKGLLTAATLVRLQKVADLDAQVTGDVRFPPCSLKQLRVQDGTFAGESPIRFVFNRKVTPVPLGPDGGIPIAGYFMLGI